MKLSDYSVAPPEVFWDTFPKNSLPEVISSSIDVEQFKKLIRDNSTLLTECEIVRGESCINSLLNGADSAQNNVLPACHCANAKSSTENGPEVTDEIANWCKKKYIAGPFKYPPLPMFRVNSLMAIVQPNKVRPVLNVSLPKKCSFNSNVIKDKLEKVKMSSARKFSYSIIKSGRYAVMTKYDMVDAYKTVPAPLSDLRLQGFQWLTRYFVELRQIFGAKTAVSNFDILGNSILTLTKAICKIPSEMIHRTLDDVPFVAPANSNLSSKFATCYEDVCKKLEVSLAPDCPKYDKAFKNSQYGKVLGIFFDTKNLSWKLPDEKKEKSVRAIVSCISKSSISINEFQKLMGRLNDISIMCPFMKCFKFPLNLCLSSAMEKDTDVVLSEVAEKDLYVWLRFLCDSDSWLPICHEYCHQPLSYKYFTSDAAGSNCNSDKNSKIGCGNIGFDSNGIIIFAYQIFWPKGILQKTLDVKMSKLGSKTTTLEFLGIIIPFLIIPKDLCNMHIVVKVDNIGCFYGWLNKKTSGDIMASILIRALHLISSYLCCIVHIEHLPRKSSWDAEIADRMSREKTTLQNDRKLLNSFNLPKVPECLWRWMEHPTEDWNLANELLCAVKNRCI